MAKLTKKRLMTILKHATSISIVVNVTTLGTDKINHFRTMHRSSFFITSCQINEDNILTFLHVITPIIFLAASCLIWLSIPPFECASRSRTLSTRLFFAKKSGWLTNWSILQLAVAHSLFICKEKWRSRFKDRASIKNEAGIKMKHNQGSSKISRTNDQGWSKNLASSNIKDQA